MLSPSDNRAVSALFRVFGGNKRSGRKVVGERTTALGMHGGERLFLAIGVPLSVWLLLADLFGGSGWAYLLAVPLTFVVLNASLYLFSARTPQWQWRIWLSVLTLGSVAVLWLDRPIVFRVAAWAWIAVAILNGISVLLLQLRRTMEWSGKAGLQWRVFLLISAHLLAIAVGFATNWPWGWLTGMAIAGVYCLAVLRPSCQWLGEVITTTQENDILITIDDGPDPEDTPKLLDLLDRYQKKAIFFMIGEKVKAHPELAREVVRRGHQIGNHTMTHPQAWFWCATPGRTRREIEACQQTIEEVTGVKPHWFRAPVGHRNGFTHPITCELGMEVMGWNRRGFDAVEKDASKVLAKILPNLENGDIVLLHESTPIAVEVLEGVLVKIAQL